MRLVAGIAARAGGQRHSDRRIGLGLLVMGLLAVAIVQRAAPVAGPPLYDGVVVVDPYRWLHPPSGQPGDPKSATATMRVDNGASPVTAIATPEQPPQAQVFGAPGGLALPAGTTSIRLSITPVDPPAPPSDGQVAGNVYRISLTNQAGAPLSALESAKVTVVLRGPADAANATIERWTGSQWQKLRTDSAGLAATYLAVVTEFGDFALVVPGAASSAPAVGQGSSASDGSSGAGSPEPSGSAAASGGAPGPGSSDGIPPIVLVAGIALVIAVVLAGGALWLRERRRRARDRRRRDRWGARPRR